MPEPNIWQLEEDTLNKIRFQVREEKSDYVLKTVCNQTDLETLTYSKLKHSSKTVNKVGCLLIKQQAVTLLMYSIIQ